MHNERLDIGIVAEVGADRIPSGMTATPLFDLEMMLILPPGHQLAAHQGPVDIGLLVQEPIIMNELSIGYGQIVGTMFNDLGIRPRVKAVVDNVETIKVMVQTGIGIALIPSGAADLEAKAGLLELRPISPSRRISINVYRPQRSLSRRKEILLHKMCFGMECVEAK